VRLSGSGTSGEATNFSVGFSVRRISSVPMGTDDPLGANSVTTVGPPAPGQPSK
jgi:methylglyoxal synthase